MNGGRPPTTTTSCQTQTRNTAERRRRPAGAPPVVMRLLPARPQVSTASSPSWPRIRVAAARPRPRRGRRASAVAAARRGRPRRPVRGAASARPPGRRPGSPRRCCGSRARSSWPRAPRAASSSRSNRSRVSASRALNGSSSSSTSGSSASARARAARWRCRPTARPGVPRSRRGRARPARQLAEPLVPALGRPAGELERVRDVVGGRPPRQQPRLLEDQPDPRVRARDRVAVERDRAAVRLEQPGDHPQERRLAAAVGPDQGDDARPPATSASMPSSAGEPAAVAGREGEAATIGRRRWRRSRDSPRPARPPASGRRIGAVAG